MASFSLRILLSPIWYYKFYRQFFSLFHTGSSGSRSGSVATWHSGVSLVSHHWWRCLVPRTTYGRIRVLSVLACTRRRCSQRTWIDWSQSATMREESSTFIRRSTLGNALCTLRWGNWCLIVIDAEPAAALEKVMHHLCNDRVVIVDFVFSLFRQNSFNINCRCLFYLSQNRW